MGLLRRSVIVGVVGFAAVPTLADYFVTDIVDAARRGDYHAVHRIITDDPEAVQARDDHSYTSLHWAGIRSHWRIFSELVAAGADANAVGADGGTPLHWTSHHDRADMAALLLDAGADVNARNRWGRSPLHVAARRGCDAVAVLLLERGADLTAETAEGWTPLHTAMMADHLGVAAILIAAGADESATDDEGRTPAEVARHRPAATEIAPDTLDDYAGIYDLGGGFTSKVWREGDDLKIREFAPDGLYPIGTDAFHSVAEPWKVEFERAEDGMVDTIVLHFLRRSIKGSKSQSPRYVGSAACMSCHNDNERGSPAVSWMRSRHGHAYWRLGADWALFLASRRPNYQDLDTPIADDRCLLCHVTGRQNDDALFADSYRAEEGIGCESCHGPGSLYMDPEVMADREAFLANGGLLPNEDTCRSCHRRSENFVFDEMWPKVAHGFEE